MRHAVVFFFDKNISLEVIIVEKKYFSTKISWYNASSNQKTSKYNYS